MSERRQEFLEELKRKIRRAEGTASEDGYSTTFGYGKYDPVSDKSITDMTFSELKQFQKGLINNTKGTFGDPEKGTSAAGAYQFTSNTLYGKNGLLAKAGLSMEDKFTPENQDRLLFARMEQDNILENISKGKPKAAQDSLAKIWASLPDSKGKYRYGQKKSEEAKKVGTELSDFIYKEAEQSVLDSKNSLGDLNPMQDTQGAEMANQIEQPEEEFELVDSPKEEEFELVSEPDFYAGTEEPSMMESFARGAATGASFGKAEELIAGTEAGTTVLKAKLQSYFDTMMKQDDMPATSLSEAYDKALNEQNEAFKEAARANPVSYLAGDIAGSFASTVATMGLGSWIKGGQALNAGSKAFLHSMNGFAHGVGRSEEDTISGVLGEGAQGAALGLAGEIFAASKGVQTASKVTDNLGKVRAGAFVKYLGAKFDTVEDNLSKVGKDAISFAERMVNKTIKIKGPAGEIIEQPLILSNMSRKDMLKRINMEADVQGSLMGDILAEADSALDITFSGSHLKNELMEDFILPMKNSNIPEHKAVAARLERYVEDMTEHVVEKTKSIDPKTGNFFYNSKTAPAEFRLKDLHEIKSFLQKQARKYRGRSADSVEEMVYQQKDAMGTRLGEIIEESIGFGGDISGKPFLEKYNIARTAYGDLAETSKILQNTIQQDSGKQFFQKIFNDRLASYATVAGGVAATAGVPYGSTILAAGALKGIANSKVVNGVLAKSANTLAQAIEANPEKLSSIASKLVTASTLSANDFVDTFMEASAEATFLTTPLARDPMEVIRRSSSVLSLVKGFDRNIAKNLEKAINMTDLDSINNIMAEVAAKVPAGYIEEGVGFGGKAYTESDIAAVTTYLQNIKNTRKRMMLTTDFNKNGLVPGEMLAPKEEPSNLIIHNKAKKDFRKKDY